jgi:hypothetical protein
VGDGEKLRTYLNSALKVLSGLDIFPRGPKKKLNFVDQRNRWRTSQMSLTNVETSALQCPLCTDGTKGSVVHVLPSNSTPRTTQQDDAIHWHGAEHRSSSFKMAFFRQAVRLTFH